MQNERKFTTKIFLEKLKKDKSSKHNSMWSIGWGHSSFTFEMPFCDCSLAHNYLFFWNKGHSRNLKTGALPLNQASGDRLPGAIKDLWGLWRRRKVWKSISVNGTIQFLALCKIVCMERKRVTRKLDLLQVLMCQILGNFEDISQNSQDTTITSIWCIKIIESFLLNKKV